MKKTIKNIKRNKKKYYGKMDKEVINLCNAINEIEGLETIESCSGHGKDTFRIFFIVTRIKSLPILLYYLRHFGKDCHSPNVWRCVVYTDCAGAQATFCIESADIGKKAYRQANRIAKCIREDLAENSRMI